MHSTAQELAGFEIRPCLGKSEDRRRLKRKLKQVLMAVSIAFAVMAVDYGVMLLLVQANERTEVMAKSGARHPAYMR